MLRLSRYEATHLERYTVYISQRYHNELHVCSLLRGRVVGVVPCVGAYSTERHPFGVTYEYMDGFDLKQYLRNEPYVGKLKLVPVALHAFSVNHLTFLDFS